MTRIKYLFFETIGLIYLSFMIVLAMFFYVLVWFIQLFWKPDYYGNKDL